MIEKKIKIIFIIPTLTAGGAQRIMAFLAKNLDKTVFDAYLIVIGKKENVAYEIDGIKVIFLNKSRVLFSLPKLFLIFLKEKPSIVMGAISHLNIVLGLISLIIPKVIFIGRQTNISKVMTEIYSTKKTSVFDYFYKSALRKLDYIVCQSSDMAKDCVRYLNLNEEKVRVIRNPITDNFKLKTGNTSLKSDHVKFITVGRLEKIKGYDRILDTLSKFRKPYIYTIIGNGPEKEFLLTKVKTLQLDGKVNFIDFTSEVPRFLRENDYFLQGSYAEGFPNALLESCAVGTPIIAINSPGGTAEIANNNVNGYLVDNMDEFLNCLNNLKTFDPVSVSQSVYEKFSKKIILNEYESFFKKILKD